MKQLFQKQWWLTAVAVLALAGPVHAAGTDVATHVKPLAQYTTSNLVKVDYDASAAPGARITSVDLYVSRNGGTYVKDQTVTSADQAFYVDTSSFGGDGLYSFYTLAQTGDTPPVVEAKTVPVDEAHTIVDAHAPAAPDASKLNINQTTQVNVNELTGAAGSVEANATVQAFSDSALTVSLGSTTANASGSFGPIAIGSSAVSPIWVVATDAAGNRGAATQITNQVSYAGALTQFTVTASDANTLVATFVAPADATTFRVEYRHAGGAVWSVDYLTVGQNGTTVTITGLQAGRAYDVRIAPVNAQLNVGTWSTMAARTVGSPVDSVVLPSEKAPVAIGVGGGTASPVATAAVASTTTTATPATTPATSTTNSSASAVTTPTPAANSAAATTPDTNTADTGNVANTPANTETTTQSTATPWVILAILIVLAGIATGGYFYWFSGPEEVTTTVTSVDDIKSDKKEEEKKDDKEDDADKRW